MVHVSLLSSTVPDWKIFQQVSETTLKRNLFAQMDARSIMKRGLPEFIMALGELISPGDNPTTHLSNPGYLLRIVHISIIVICDESIGNDIAKYTDLDVMDFETIRKDVVLAVISGTLQQWRTSIINCLTEKEDDPLREFFSQSLLLFEKMGLGKLWENYTQTSTTNGTQLTAKG